MAPSLDGSPPTLVYGSPAAEMSLDELDWDDDCDAPTRLLPAKPEIADDPTDVDVDPPALTRSSRPPASAQVTVRTLVLADRVAPRAPGWSRIATVLAALALAASLASVTGTDVWAGRADVYAATPPQPAATSDAPEEAPEAAPVGNPEPPPETGATPRRPRPAGVVRPRPSASSVAPATTRPEPATRSVDGDLGMLSDVGAEPGMVSLDSTPPAKVLLDGRPLGTTPIAGAGVPAGMHTVTFIHPELGRKTIGVHVHAGEASVAGVRFP